MEAAAVGINIAEALLVTTYPDATVLVFTDGEDGAREILLEMFEQVLVVVETVETVFVGAHPTASLAVNESADDTRLTDAVLLFELIAHVVELGDGSGLHEDTLLQKAQPDIAASILDDRVDFAHSEVDLAAEVGIILQLTCLGVVDGQSHTIVAEHHLTVASTVDG